MKKTVLKIAVSLIILIICSCATSGANTGNQITGIFTGTIPAADCPGIVVVAILEPSGYFKFTYQYIDRDAALVTYTGTYTFDEKSKTITLSRNDLPPFYKLKGNYLIQLDLDKNEIKGDLAKMYRLRKL